MLRKAFRDYVFTTKYYRVDVIIVLLFLFFILAIGGIKFPKEVPMGFLGLGFASITFLLGPYVGFIFYFITTFFRSIPVPGLPISLNQIIGVLFIMSWINWLLRGKVNFPRGRLALFFTVVFVYFLINCFAAEDFAEGAFHAWYVAIYFFIALSLASVVREKRHFHAIFWIVLLTTFLSSLLGFFELVSGIDILTKSGARWMGRVRINGAAPNSIVFAYQLLYAFPLGYYLFSEGSSFRSRFLALGLSIFITMIALFTFNRQTILVIGFTYFISALLYRNRYSKIFMGIVLAMFLLMGPFVMRLIWSRLQTMKAGREDRSLTLRLDGLQVGKEMVRRHPFMGVGLGCYHIMWWEYIPVGKTRILQYLKGTIRYPDIGYNQLLSEGGLIGFGITAGFFLFLLFYLWKSRKRALIEERRDMINLYSALFNILAIFLLSSFIQDTFLYVRTWIMFGLILATLHKPFQSDKIQKSP
jgi:O-antigen ligase